MSNRRFFPEFGATSFVLAVFALAFGWLAGHVAQTVRREIPDSNAAVYWGVAALIVVLAAVVFAVGFGIASLFGYGKVNGRSRKLLAVAGILLGGLVGAAWASLPFAVSAARRAAEAKENEPITRHDYGFQLGLPGEGWQLLRDAAARQLNPFAAAAAIRSPGEPDEMFGMVLVESAPELDADALDLTELAAALAENMAFDKKELVFVENVEFQGRPAAQFQVIFDAQGKSVRWQEVVFLHDGHLFQVVAAGPVIDTKPDGSTFIGFFEAFSLLGPDGSVENEETPHLPFEPSRSKGK
jgi:hypothetical protein